VVLSQGYGTLSFFSSKDESIFDMLIRAGLKPNSSRVLLSLHYNTGLTSREIEKITGLRQPEVSIAIHDLINRGWILVSEQCKGDSVRTMKHYRLLHSIDIVLDSIRTETEDVCKNRVAILETIRVRLSEIHGYTGFTD